MIETYTFQADAYTIELSPLGASIVRLLTPDRNRRFENIVFTYADKSRYEHNTKFPGATIGPLAGRVYPPEIFQNGKTYTLKSDHAVHHHSGRDNLAFKRFEMEKGKNAVIFTLKPTYEHFPAADMVRVIYRFHPDGFTITHETTTDHDTYSNLTNHTYFNLGGEGHDSLDHHTLRLNADRVYTLSEHNIPMNCVPVKHTWFDFTEERPLKDSLKALADTPQRGIDHCFVFSSPKEITLKCAQGGRCLHITTDYPSVQVYTNNFPADDPAEGFRPDKAHSHICFETQYPPNDMHRDQNPGSFQRKHTTRTHTTSYTFKEEEDDSF